jgi:hypothetical protein
MRLKCRRAWGSTGDLVREKMEITMEYGDISSHDRNCLITKMPFGRMQHHSIKEPPEG